MARRVGIATKAWRQYQAFRHNKRLCEGRGHLLDPIYNTGHFNPEHWVHCPQIYTWILTGRCRRCNHEEPIVVKERKCECLV